MPPVRRQHARPAGRGYRAPFLEDLGYEVKGEVRGCDVVAIRPGGGGPVDPPVVVELKLAFTLGFVLQGVDRLAITDLVYLAVPARLGLASPGR